MLNTEMRNEKTKNIDKMSTFEMIKLMNEENMNAVKAVGDCAESIAEAIDVISERMAKGGRLFYVGAGTSGRLGVVDASECPPTFGVDYDKVIGVIAGGRDAMFRANEGGEDKAENGRADLESYNLNENDSVMGISAAGGAAYVVGALEYAKECGCATISLSCNPDTKIAKAADIEIFTDTGAEVITGSTRLKAGTAQKLVLNMISTFCMVKNGYVYENLMINLQPTNIKLRDRMVRIVCDILGTSYEESEALLEKSDWSIRKAVEK